MSDVSQGPLNMIGLTIQGCPAQHPKSGGPGLNEVLGPVKGSPGPVWLPASVTSRNLHCGLGGQAWQAQKGCWGPSWAGGLAAAAAGGQRGDNAYREAAVALNPLETWRARPQQEPRGRTTRKRWPCLAGSDT